MTERGGGSRRWGLLAAAGSGLALGIAFPGPDLGPLALVALVPLFVVWRDAGPGRAALAGFVAGLAFFGFHLSWTWYFGTVAIVPLVALQAAFWAGAGAVVGWCGRARVRSPLLVAAVWVVFEAFRTRWPLGGLAWGQVGVALHDVDAARALASWGGVPLVSFVVVGSNAALAELWARRRDRQRRRAPAIVAGALVVATLVATTTRFEPTPTGRIRFALIQGNDKNRYLTQAEFDSEYLTRSHLQLASTLRGRYDLIVFPESSLMSDPETDPVLRARISAIARRHDSWVMANAIDDVSEPGKSFNANRLYDPSGRLVSTYAKRHLVPFGEYVPWRDSLTFIEELAQIPHDFTPGRRIEVEPVRGHRVASVICFESAFGPLMRENVVAGAEAIVVTTNNRSYRRSANSAQHVALSQMSAAAVGRPVLHASISGITAVIDSEGAVHQTTELFENEVVTGTVAPTRGETPYVRWGDWVEWGSGAAVLGVTGAALVLGVRRRRTMPPATSADGSPT